jgi:hypothetical protein
MSPLGTVGASLALALCSVTPAEAAPTTACKALARQFAEKAEMDTSDLAKLRTCVSVELNAQLTARRPAPPTPLPSPAPAPAPSPAPGPK